MSIDMSSSSSALTGNSSNLMSTTATEKAVKSAEATAKTNEIETAKQLLREGKSVEYVVNYTGLPQLQVSQLQSMVAP